MKKLGIVALLAAATAVPAVAGAQQNYGQNRPNQMYAGLDFSFLNVESIDGLDGQATGVQARGGYMFTPMLGVEGRLGLGLTEGSDSLGPGFGDTDLGVDNWIGAYARAQWPVMEQLSVYGLLGFTRVSLDISGINSDAETDVSYGIGADYMLSDRLGVEADYMMLTDKSDAEVSAWTIGAKYLF